MHGVLVVVGKVNCVIYPLHGLIVSIVLHVLLQNQTVVSFILSGNYRALL